MAKHVYLRNADQGYLYRIYPKFQEMKWDKLTEKEKQAQIFVLPPESNENPNIKSTIHGEYMDKYTDKGMFVVLGAKASILITDEIIDQQEERTLRRDIHVEVNEAVYNYNFQRGHKYLLTIDNVRAL